MAGWAPDDMICAVREWLARGRVVDVARAVVFTAVANRIPVTRPDSVLLHDLLAEAGHRPDHLSALDLVEDPQPPCQTMSPVHPDRHTADGLIPHSLDLTGPPEYHGEVDALDRIAITVARDAATGIAPVHGLWRAWRSPAFVSLWPKPRRVYLVGVRSDDHGLLPGIAARWQSILGKAGEAHPQVEVFVDAASLPPYQRTALAWSALLWTPHPTPAVQIAGVFDAVEEAGGPGFSVTRPSLDDGERDRVLGYLDSGSPVLPTTALMEDVMDAQRHAVVPMGFRTDGLWIWCDATAYFLRRHHVAPDPELLRHIRARGYEPSTVDIVALHRAVAALESVTIDDDE
jgi:hypothetical protein